MVVVGVVLALIATSLFNVVFLLQKLAVRAAGDIDRRALVASYRRIFLRREYLLSFALLFAGGMLFIGSLRLAGLAVVAPVQNFGLLVLALGARRFLGERLDLSARLAIALLVVMPFFILKADVQGPQHLADVHTAVAWIGMGAASVIGLGLLTRVHAAFWPCLVAAMNVVAQIALQAFTLGFDPDRPLKNAASSVAFLLLTLVFALLGPQLAIPAALQRMSITVFAPVMGTLVTLGSIVVAVLVYHQTIGSLPAYLAGVACGVVAIFALGRLERSERRTNELGGVGTHYAREA